MKSGDALNAYTQARQLTCVQHRMHAFPAGECLHKHAAFQDILTPIPTGTAEPDRGMNRLTFLDLDAFQISEACSTPSH